MNDHNGGESIVDSVLSPGHCQCNVRDDIGVLPVLAAVQELQRSSLSCWIKVESSMLVVEPVLVFSMTSFGRKPSGVAHGPNGGHGGFC